MVFYRHDTKENVIFRTQCSQRRIGQIYQKSHCKRISCNNYVFLVPKENAFFPQHNTKIRKLISLMVWEQLARIIRALKTPCISNDIVLFKQICLFFLLCVYLISELHELYIKMKVNKCPF